MVDRKKTDPDVGRVTLSGTHTAFLKDHGWEFVKRCDRIGEQMMEATLVLRRGPLYMHDFDLAKISVKISGQAEGLGRKFIQWTTDPPPPAHERLIHIQLYRELELAVTTVATELEEKRVSFERKGR